MFMTDYPISTDLFTFSELPISHPVYYARAGTTVQGHKGVRGWLAAKKKYNRRGKNERFSPKVVCFLDFTLRSLKINCQKNLLLVFWTKIPVRDDNGKKCATLERFPKTELETKELQVIWIKEAMIVSLASGALISGSNPQVACCCLPTACEGLSNTAPNTKTETNIS